MKVKVIGCVRGWYGITPHMEHIKRRGEDMLDCDTVLHISHVDPVMYFNGWIWNHDDVQSSGYHLWYIRQGHIHVSTEHGEYDLLPGDMYLFRLNERHWCTRDPDNPFNMLVVVFGLFREGRPLMLGATEMPYFGHFSGHPFMAELMLALVEDFATTDSAVSDLWLRAVLQAFVQGERHKNLARNNANPVISGIIRSIHYNPDGDYTLDTLVHTLGYSKNHIINLFKKQVGMTPGQYVISRRMEKAKQLLAFSSLPINAVSQRLGYKDVCYFSRQFKQETGFSPQDYRCWKGMDMVMPGD